MKPVRVLLLLALLALMPLAGVALADSDGDEDPSSEFTAFTINGSTGPLTVAPGDTLNYSASAVEQGTSNPVPNGYGVRIIENNAVGCSSDTNLTGGSLATATRSTATTTSGTATGSFPAPTTPGTYFYWPRHDSQSLPNPSPPPANLTWGTTNGFTAAGGSKCIQVNVQEAQPPTSTISTEIHREPGHTVVTSVTMGATIHDKATVTTTVNPIPAGSSVDFQFFKNGNCSGTPFSVENVALTGGSTSEAVESSSYLVLAADIATGLSYKGIFNSGNTSQVPNATGDCEPLTVLSSITGFHYHVISGPDAVGNPGTYDCTLPGSAKGTSTPCPAGTTAASITQGATNTYKVHVTVTNDTGATISEKVQGGLSGAPGATYSVQSVSCAASNTVTIDLSKRGNVVTWTISSMASGTTCDLEVDVNNLKFSGTGDQPVSSSWSEFQCLLDGPNAGFCEKSPYTNNLMAIVN
jgi:hypothetical protein